eukprot:jgi/Chlat1/6078/Chrsp4S06347
MAAGELVAERRRRLEALLLGNALADSMTLRSFAQAFPRHTRQAYYSDLIRVPGRCGSCTGCTCSTEGRLGRSCGMVQDVGDCSIEEAIARLEALENSAKAELRRHQAATEAIKKQLDSVVGALDELPQPEVVSPELMKEDAKLQAMLGQ